MHNSHKELKQLIKKEKVLLAKILIHLKVINDEKIYIELGYNSLIQYCIKALGYSESAAYRRKSALRLEKKIPSAIEKISEGNLTLAQAIDLNKNIEEKEKRTRKKLSDKQKEKLCKEIKGKTTKESNDQTRSTLGLKEEKREIIIKVTEDTYEKWIKFKARNASKRMTDELLFRHAIDKAENVRPTRPYRKAKPTKSKNKRYIPAALKRKVLSRAKNQCQYPNCNEVYGLEVDHIMPISKGGQTTLSNLQLLCRNHNAYKSDKILPSKFMKKKKYQT